jgi:hypothetical protein
VAVWQRLQQNGIYDTENGRRRTDREGQSDNGGDGYGWPLTKRPKRKANVMRD